MNLIFFFDTTGCQRTDLSRGLHERDMGGYKPGEQQYFEIIFHVEDMAYEGRPEQQSRAAVVNYVKFV